MVARVSGILKIVKDAAFAWIKKNGMPEKELLAIIFKLRGNFTIKKTIA